MSILVYPFSRGFIYCFLVVLLKFQECYGKNFDSIQIVSCNNSDIVETHKYCTFIGPWSDVKVTKRPKYECIAKPGCKPKPYNNFCDPKCMFTENVCDGDPSFGCNLDSKDNPSLKLILDDIGMSSGCIFSSKFSSYESEDSEKGCSQYCLDKEQIPCPYIIKSQMSGLTMENRTGDSVWSKCTNFCTATNVVVQKSSLTDPDNGLLWSCEGMNSNYSTTQVILRKNMCDGLIHCLNGHDESEVVCPNNWHHIFVFTISGSLICFILTQMIKKIKDIQAPYDCGKCNLSYKIKLDIDIWSKIVHFMELEFAPDFREWQHRDINDSEEEIKRAYKDLHENTCALPYIYTYIRKRIQTSFTLSNWKIMIHKQHKIYKCLYEKELSCHNNDGTKALLCLKHRLGLTADVSEMMYYKNTPTFFTEVDCFFNTLVRRSSIVFRSLIPLLKVTALVFDIIKDYLLLHRMVRTLVKTYQAGEAENITQQDVVLVSSYTLSIFAAHILSAFYAYRNRNYILKTCEHKQPKWLSRLFSVASIVFFPFLGSIMATISEMEILRIEEKFSTVRDDAFVMTVTYFEDLLSHNSYNDKSNLNGFTGFNLLEASTEAYAQILITIALLSQDPFDGKLNRSLIGFGTTNQWQTIALFVGSTFLSYILLVFKHVSFFSMVNGHTMELPEKIVIWLAYFSMITLNLFLTTVVGLTRGDLGDMIPFLVNIGIATIKILVLVACSKLLEKDWNVKNRLHKVIFIASNLVAPMPFGNLETISDQNNESFYRRFRATTCLFLIFFFEAYTRGLYACKFASEEILNSAIPGMSVNIVWIILVIKTFIILAIASFFLHFQYLYKHVLYTTVDKSTKTQKSSQHFLISLSLTVLICTILIFCNSTIVQKSPNYKDCNDVWNAGESDGIYPIYPNNESSQLSFTTCIGNKTLVQKTDPDSGNKQEYFYRNMKDYISGFGRNQREMFIGLDTIYHLNQIGNTELTLIATMTNGTIIRTTFSNFQITKKVVDNYAYSYFTDVPSRFFPIKNDEHYRNSTENYSITSIENSDNFIFIYPNYLKNISAKEETKKRCTSCTAWTNATNGDYYDFHFASFTAIDSQDNQCAQSSKSGWWFPIHIFIDDSNSLNDVRCNRLLQNDLSDSSGSDDARSFLTNLNGPYYENDKLNQRQIAFCGNNRPFYSDVPSSDACLYRDYDRSYVFRGEMIKLKNTMLFLSQK